MQIQYVVKDFDTKEVLLTPPNFIIPRITEKIIFDVKKGLYNARVIDISYQYENVSETITNPLEKTIVTIEVQQIQSSK